MNRESVELGFILRHIPDYEFSMKKFSDRLKLQKTLYLLQAFGVYLGYDFSWYLRGSYCSILTTNGFLLEDIYHEIPDVSDVKFKRKKAQQCFKNFLDFIIGKNIDELEIAASLHYLKQIRTRDDDDYIKKKVANKQERFTHESVNKIWSELKKCQLI